MTKLLKRFAENVYVNLIAGLVLLISSSIEIVRSLEEGEIGAHHGIVVFALLQISKALPDLVHGAEEVSKIGD